MGGITLAEEIARLVKLGILDPTKPATAQRVDNARDRLKQLNKYPHFREFAAKADEANYESVYKPRNVTHNIVAPEDWAGHTLVNYKTDRSDLGTVESYLGNPMDTKVQSGTKFTPAHADQGLGWMSMGSDTDMSGIANKAHRKAIAAEQLTERPSVASSFLMGTESSRFSTPVANMMLKTIKENMPSKRALDEFDAEMRKTDPEWVGIRSKDALNQLEGKNGFSMKGAGAHRKRFLQVLENPRFRDQGFPQPNTVLPIIDNPDYQGLPIGTQGINMWLPDTSRRIENRTGLHDSYSHGMPLLEGTMGRYEVPISFAAQNPAVMRALEGIMTNPTKPSKRTGKIPSPKPQTELQKMNVNLDSSAGVPGTIQNIDQEAIDSANKAIEHNKKLIAKYGSLAAAIASGQAMADEKQDPNYNPFASLVRKYGFSEANRMIMDMKRKADRRMEVIKDRDRMLAELDDKRDPLDVSDYSVKRDPKYGKDVLGAVGTGLEQAMHSIPQMATREGMALTLGKALGMPEADRLIDMKLKQVAPEYKRESQMGDFDYELFKLIGGFASPY